MTPEMTRMAFHSMKGALVLFYFSHTFVSLEMNRIEINYSQKKETIPIPMCL